MSTPICHFLENVVIDRLPPPGLGVGDRAPELEDEVVREPEGLEVRVVDGLRQLHRVGLPLRQVPDLRGWKRNMFNRDALVKCAFRAPKRALGSQMSV